MTDKDLNTNLKRVVNAVLEQYPKAKREYERGVDAAEDFLIREIMDNCLGSYNVKDVREALEYMTDTE